MVDWLKGIEVYDVLICTLPLRCGGNELSGYGVG